MCPKGATKGLWGLLVLQHCLQAGDALREGVSVCVYIHISRGSEQGLIQPFKDNFVPLVFRAVGYFCVRIQCKL